LDSTGDDRCRTVHLHSQLKNAINDRVAGASDTRHPTLTVATLSSRQEGPLDKPLYRTMTPDEVNEAVLAGRVVSIPVGQLETHGPHLPIDVDVVQVQNVVDEAAARTPDVFVAAPPIYYGFSEHVMDFPGTMNIRPEIMIEYLFDVCRSFARQGFERIVLVNGHGSNRPICEIVTRRVTNETTAMCATLGHFSLARDVLHQIRESPHGGTAHACEAETSEYLYLRPELVQRDKIADEYAPDYRPWRSDDFTEDAGPVHFMEFWSQRSRSGTEGAPSLATAEKGKLLQEASIEKLIEFGRWWKTIEFPPRTDSTVRRSPRLNTHGAPGDN
jgi:creatinine amidohydrolase